MNAFSPRILSLGMLYNEKKVENIVSHDKMNDNQLYQLLVEYGDEKKVLEFLIRHNRNEEAAQIVENTEGIDVTKVFSYTIKYENEEFLEYLCNSAIDTLNLEECICLLAYYDKTELFTKYFLPRLNQELILKLIIYCCKHDKTRIMNIVKDIPEFLQLDKLLQWAMRYDRVALVEEHYFDFASPKDVFYDCCENGKEKIVEFLVKRMGRDVLEIGLVKANKFPEIKSIIKKELTKFKRECLVM